jgi:hypothetical protein
MKIVINQELKDMHGIVILNENKSALTLKDICSISILNPVQGDDEKTKLMKYDIFKKLRSAKVEVNLIVEEIALIKKCISHFQPPLIMGQCFEMLEGK